MWFYEHNNLFSFVDDKSVPHIVRWVNLYNCRKCDVLIFTELLGCDKFLMMFGKMWEFLSESIDVDVLMCRLSQPLI